MRTFLFAVLSVACGSTGGSVDDGLRVLIRDASTSADASVLANDAGVDGPPRNIEITSWMIGQAGDDGGERTGLQVQRLADVRAQWRWADGGWGSSQAAWLEDAGYLISGVPEGEATVIFPTFGGLATRASKLDFSLDVQGRPDVERTNPGTRTLVRIEMSGGLPWADGDSLTFFGRETPFVFSEQPSLPTGASLINLNDNWQVDRKPLLQGSRGDSFAVFQLRPPSTAAIPYRSVIAAGSTVAPDLVDGSNVTFSVVLSEPLPTSIGVRLDVPTAIQALGEARPATPVAGAGFVITYRRGLHRVGVVTRGNNGLEAGMQVLSAVLPATQPVFQGQVQWGDVFPREELLATMSARMNVVLSAGLAGGTLEVPYERSLPLTGSQVNLDVTMSPPRALSVNGEPAVGNRVDVTTTPTLSWSAPVRGTTNRYSVTIYDLADKTFKKSFFTTRTTLDVPPFTLVAGKTYAFVVVAERGAYDLLRPTYTPAETERIGACSDSFTP